MHAVLMVLTQSSLKTMSLKIAPTAGRVDRAYIPRTGSGEPIAQVQLKGQTAITSSQWPPPTPTLTHGTAGHPLLGVPSVHSLGKHAWNHMCLTDYPTVIWATRCYPFFTHLEHLMEHNFNSDGLAESYVGDVVEWDSARALMTGTVTSGLKMV